LTIHGKATPPLIYAVRCTQQQTSPLFGRRGWRSDGTARWRRFACGFVGSGPSRRAATPVGKSAQSCCLVRL